VARNSFTSLARIVAALQLARGSLFKSTLTVQSPLELEVESNSLKSLTILDEQKRGSELSLRHSSNMELSLTGDKPTINLWVPVSRIIIPANAFPVNLHRVMEMTESIRKGHTLNSPLLRIEPSDYFSVTDGRHRFLARVAVGQAFIWSELENDKSECELPSFQERLFRYAVRS
jgi:hypothetical protein